MVRKASAELVKRQPLPGGRVGVSSEAPHFTRTSEIALAYLRRRQPHAERSLRAFGAWARTEASLPPAKRKLRRLLRLISKLRATVVSTFEDSNEYAAHFTEALATGPLSRGLGELEFIARKLIRPDRRLHFAEVVLDACLNSKNPIKPPTPSVLLALAVYLGIEDPTLTAARHDGLYQAWKKRHARALRRARQGHIFTQN